MNRLFGTDGVRGPANTAPITAETATGLGRAAALHFRALGHSGPVVLGRDTRVSGDMLEHAAAAGVSSAGVDAIMTGVLPTPGISFLVKEMGGMAGMVLSASHNPWEDNGIKLFGPGGAKLSDKDEEAVEALFREPPARLPRETGRIRNAPSPAARYMDFLVSWFRGFPEESGLRVVLDCGNGATSWVAPRVFSRVGLSVRTIHCRPDGTNINRDCGSQHTRDLEKEVKETGAALGFAFDGDGDRCIAVDEAGRPVSGDRILLACARALDATGRLANRTVVSTVMSNLGLKKALAADGIRHVETDVGDRQVLKAMEGSGAVLGGEDSGHMIFSDRHATGDGILTGLELLSALAAGGRPLSALTEMEVFPQVLLNVPVRERKDLESLPGVATAVEGARKSLGNDGRVLVRYSGTRPVCRVMVEGRDQETTLALAEGIARAVKAELGAA